MVTSTEHGEGGSRSTHEAMEEISTSECWSLVRGTQVGRIAVVVDSAPDIFPVNHVVDHGSIVLRTAAGTKLFAADGRDVAFEVDGFDAATGQAWSVVLKGVAHEVRQMHDVLDAMSLPLFPWVQSSKPHFIRIEPDEVSGRRFHAARPA